MNEKYHKYLNSVEWRATKRYVFLVKGYECERCGYTRNLQIHHKTYDNLYQERLEDLEVLCGSCHMKEHNIKPQKKKPVKTNKNIVIKKGYLLVTEELVKTLETGRGGFTKKTIEAFGFTYPPQKGWKRKIINTQIREDKYKLALDAHKKRLSKKKQ